MLRAYGAELQLTPGTEGMQGALDLANELSSSIPNSFQFNQFENFANPDIHERTTAQEIWSQTNNNVDGLITGVGTGGTVTGCARFLKKLILIAKYMQLNLKRYCSIRRKSRFSLYSRDWSRFCPKST